MRREIVRFFVSRLASADFRSVASLWGLSHARHIRGESYKDGRLQPERGYLALYYLAFGVILRFTQSELF